MHLPRTAAALTVGAAALSGLTLLTPAADASGGTAVRASGACSVGATWKLKAKPDDGRLEIELEVDTNRVGRTWAVRITDDGTSVFSGSRTTLAPSGSFTVHVRPTNPAGSDVIRARATDTVSGQVCSGSLTV